MGKGGVDMKWRARIGCLVVILFLSLLLCGVSFAQGCAMCYTSVANSTQAQQARHTLNAAILFLLIPAASLFVAIFLIAYRYRNFFREPSSESTILSSGVQEPADHQLEQARDVAA